MRVFIGVLSAFRDNRFFNVDKKAPQRCGALFYSDSVTSRIGDRRFVL